MSLGCAAPQPVLSCSTCRFAPFCIIRRNAMAAYDVRFRGVGLSKVCSSRHDVSIRDGDWIMCRRGTELECAACSTNTSMHLPVHADSGGHLEHLHNLRCDAAALLHRFKLHTASNVSGSQCRYTVHSSAFLVRIVGPSVVTVGLTKLTGHKHAAMSCCCISQPDKCAASAWCLSDSTPKMCCCMRLPAHMQVQRPHPASHSRRAYTNSLRQKKQKASKQVLCSAWPHAWTGLLRWHCSGRQHPLLCTCPFQH